MLVLTVGMLASVIVVYLVTQPKPQPRSRAERRLVSTPEAIVVVAFLGFFGYLYFKDFNHVKLHPDFIELHYSWPRSSVVLGFKEIESVRTNRNPRHKRRISIEFLAKGKSYSSAQTTDSTA